VTEIKLDIELTSEEALYLLQSCVWSAVRFVIWSQEEQGVIDAQVKKRIKFAQRMYETLTKIYPPLAVLVKSDWDKIKDIETR
jgi:hypothetical protein